MGAVLAAAAGLGARISLPGESLWGKSKFKLPPRAKEKRTIIAAPKGVVTLSAKVLARSIFFFTGGFPSNRDR
jgi:hypothetical protein